MTRTPKKPKKKKLSIQEKNLLLLEKHLSCPALIYKRFGNLLTLRRSQALQHHLVTEELTERVFKNCLIMFVVMKKSKLARNRIFSTLVFPLKKQLDDLSRQIEFVRRPIYSEYTLITDIGSGINFKRKGLQALLDSCLQNRIGEVVIAYRDRLCRFGFELIESLVIKAGGKITVIGSENEEIDESKELAEDLLAIVTIFSCRQMGKRSYSNKKRQNKNESNKDKIVPNECSETITE